MIREYFKNKQDKKDILTDVYSREVIEEYAVHLIENKVPFTFAILDIDNFKYINDNYGHLFGDLVLKQMGKAMVKIVEDSAVIGRYGGDEFIIIFENIKEYDDVWHSLHDLLGIPQFLEDKRLVELNMSVTIGCARFPLDSNNIDGLFELADKALYRGKMKGRNCFIIYLPEKHANINLKTQRDKIVSSAYLHSKTFSCIANAANIKTGIAEVINFLGNYYMIDHLCIDTGEKLYFNYYHSLCKKRDFKPIPRSIAKSNFNPMIEMCTVNYITEEEANKTKLNKILHEDGIFAVALCNISAGGEEFGTLRADISSIGRGRIWQEEEKAILLSCANIIALVLHFQKKKIENL